MSHHWRDVDPRSRRRLKEWEPATIVLPTSDADAAGSINGMILPAHDGGSAV
ncbi:MAG: hypothetical protein HOU01_25850 [Streptomycetaceae bacterium]|nr:hypothetical protein [Streptomycetaceae bacterium]